MLWEKLQSAVRWITEREKGGVIQPETPCLKSGQPVLDFSRSKEPEDRPPSAQSLDAYVGKPTGNGAVEITYRAVATVARQLLGSVGPGGVDSISLKPWLLRFGVVIIGLG